MGAAFIAVAFLLALAPYGQGAASADEPSGLEVAAALENVLADAIARCEKSVVSIARVAGDDPLRDPVALDAQPDFFGGRKPSPADPDFQPAAFATGVIVGPGLALTNHHVLAAGAAGDSYFITTVDKKVYRARIKASDPRSDMAVLEVTDKFAAEDFVSMPLGEGSKLRKGQIVVALGNPYAIARDGQASAAWGIVANLQRKAAPSADDRGRRTLHHYGTLIQTDAKLSLGTSGGALLNLKGEMVGLTTSLAAVAGFEQAAGYAIPVDDVFRRVLGELKEGREPGFGLIGVQFDPERSTQLAGVRVAQSVPGGPASRAGIQPNDVLLAVNEHPIRDRDELMLRVGGLAPGSVARISLERDGRKQQKEVTLSKSATMAGQVVTNPPPRWRGLRIDYASALADYEARARAGQIPADPCVCVLEVTEESPAWAAGLRPGMLISHASGQRVSTPEEFEKLIAAKEGNVPLKIIDGAGRSSTIVVPAKAL